VSGYRHLFTPKLWSALREGYDAGALRADATAGLTVAIVALPLAMAIGVASGVSPDKGLITAIVAGLLISALGGSRFQIGGPTGAFIPVVYAIIVAHGFDGLVLATLMSSLILIAAALLRVGTLMKYMPQPLITGFTAGIAVIIAASQLPELIGVQVENLPAEFVPKLVAIWQHRTGFNGWALGIALGCTALIVVLRRIAPSAPGLLFAVLLAALAVRLFDLPVATIGSRFGGITAALPSIALPAVDVARIVELLPAAFTIAFLAGVESLLSAVVADGMSGGRHRSNAELLAQGVANGASALVGGLPATGAIARTATNIRAGARTPVAGILHALFILVFVLAAADLAAYVPLPALAGVLLVVAWNMSDHAHFRHTLSAPKGDRLVLLLTFGLTVLVDLTLAIEVGMVVAAFAFMHRMAGVVEVGTGLRMIDEAEDELAPSPGSHQREALPDGVEVFQISGPLFFGAANRLDNVLDQFYRPPKVFILRMRLVPIIDASGVHALTSLLERCQRKGIVLVISGLRAQPRRVLAQMQFHPRPGALHFVEGFAMALELARQLIEADASDDSSPDAAG
jgi:SulP family sulfate permease